MSYSAAFSQAIEVIMYIYIKSNEPDSGHYLTIKVMSEGLNIPAPTLTKVITHLKTAQLINGKTGANGGFALTRSVEEISLYQIFQAIEGKKPLFKIHDQLNADLIPNVEQAKRFMSNGIDILSQAEKQMLDVLKKTHISDLIHS